jgi:hypothetical protein
MRRGLIAWTLALAALAGCRHSDEEPRWIAPDHPATPDEPAVSRRVPVLELVTDGAPAFHLLRARPVLGGGEVLEHLAALCPSCREGAR